jgi:hypothetical protein
MRCHNHSAYEAGIKSAVAKVGTFDDAQPDAGWAVEWSLSLSFDATDEHPIRQPAA